MRFQEILLLLVGQEELQQLSLTIEDNQLPHMIEEKSDD
jgi:hypothetical protein